MGRLARLARLRVIAASSHAATLRAYLAEARTKVPDKKGNAPRETETGQEILAADPVERISILRGAFIALCGSSDRPFSASSRHYLGQLVSRLLRARLPYATDDMQAMVRAAARTMKADRLPLAGLMRAVELFAEENGIEEPLRRELEDLRRWARWGNHAKLRKTATRIDNLIEEPPEEPSLGPGPWADIVTPRMAGMEKADRIRWTALMNYAANAKGSRPSPRWVKHARTLVDDLGAEAFVAQLEAWLEGFEPDPWQREVNLDVIKGIIWTAASVDDESVASLLRRFGEKCFRKVAFRGPRSIRLGNACLAALGAMPRRRGIARLTSLRSKARYLSVRKQIERTLAAAAERAGITVGELEEMSVPDYGLSPDGSIQSKLGEFTAEIRITGTDEAALAWKAPDGKPRKTVPAAVKRDHGDALKALRSDLKEIKFVLSGQRARIEGLFLAERRWSFADWRERYIDDPLLSHIARRLIWEFRSGERHATAMGATNGTVSGLDGAPIGWIGEDTQVALWHPIESDADEVLAWRRQLAALEITQPFKQAHREIYLLTDAERATRTYSNRFAAHVLRQHQLRALCQQRGWRYDVQSEWWDSHNFPEKRIEERDIMAQFRIDRIEMDSADFGAGVGIYRYVTTSHLRFTDLSGGNWLPGEPVPLDRVPPMIFSEVMRDVDLFVGVAGVGNDPNWFDGGPDGRYRDYWWGYSFGDLAESAKTRRAALEELLPRLNIASRCKLMDRFLIVRGNRRTYKIHLGSGNILMSPNDQYLCIVPDHRKATSKNRVRLPFEGDGVLSLILSKAFMLADDDKITDRTILSQIGG